MHSAPTLGLSRGRSPHLHLVESCILFSALRTALRHVWISVTVADNLAITFRIVESATNSLHRDGLAFVLGLCWQDLYCVLAQIDTCSEFASLGSYISGTFDLIRLCCASQRHTLVSLTVFCRPTV